MRTMKSLYDGKKLTYFGLLICFLTCVLCYYHYFVTPMTLSWKSTTIGASILWSPLHSRMKEKYHNVTSTSDGTAAVAQCRHVLRNMLKGKWRPRKMTSAEIQKMSQFHKKVREEELNLPKGVQRQDKRCGNVTVTPWIRGLCDPEGETPCCFNNQCVARPKQACGATCGSVHGQCFDMRIPVHAEYSDWIPSDPACADRAGNWSVREVCSLLRGSTLVFIGDSLVRHMYTALLLAIRGDDLSGAFAKTIPQNLRSTCSGIYMFTEKVCRLQLDTNAQPCNGTVGLQLHYLFSGQYAGAIIKQIMSLQNKTRSFVFLGVGFHDQFEVDLITGKLLKPLLTAMRSRRLVWPKLMWAPVHKFGMMRRANLNHKGIRLDVEGARTFNNKVAEFLKPWAVPVFDTFGLTDNVTSFDGQHYGFGVNRMKVRILLTYLLELQSTGQWGSL